MRPLSSFTLLAIAASQLAAVCAVVVPCGKGTYLNTSDNLCYYCAPGTFNKHNTPPDNFCENATPGHKACGPQFVGGNPCYGAEDEAECGEGYYQPNYGMSTCTICPAGHKCAGAHESSPEVCNPGRYQATEGGGHDGCPQCPAGTYSNAWGAKSCCKCCAGSYSSSLGSRSCEKCPDNRPWSLPGSPSNNDPNIGCRSQSLSVVLNPEACIFVTPSGGHPIGQAYCAPETGSDPVNTGKIYNKRRSLKCPVGLKRCPHASGTGGFDCVDIRSDPESCGGCASWDGSGGDGVDCTGLPHVSVTRCVKGKCVIDSCARRHALSPDGASCQPVDHAVQFQRRQRQSRSHADI